MKVITKALAKVNLTLEVLGRRPDGYHEITSILQTISLADELAIFEGGLPQEDQGGEPFSSAIAALACEGAEIPPAENLVTRAVGLLSAEADRDTPLAITLCKHIPLAAGLGGGSSDAASTLRALKALWSLDVPDERLFALASQLGSDVPFFLLGGAVLATGRGENLKRLPELPQKWLLLATPPQRVPNKTKLAYSLLNPTLYATGEHTARLVASLLAGNDLRDADLFNTFENVAADLFPGLDPWRRRLEQAIRQKTHLAGAGPTVFALFNAEEEAREASGRWQGSDGSVGVAQFVPRLPELQVMP